MKSLFSLIKDYPSLRIYSIRAGIAFGSFLAMWSCLAFKMGQAPFYADSDVIGILGLCGIAGASTASLVGKYVKKVGIRNFNFIGCGLILLAWALLYFCGNTYAGIIAGVLLIDIGMQCIQLSNQTSIFDICPSASNRVNTIFMTTISPAVHWGPSSPELLADLGLGRSSRHRHGADPAVSSDYHLPQRATACPIPLIFFHGKRKRNFKLL